MSVPSAASRSMVTVSVASTTNQRRDPKEWEKVLWTMPRTTHVNLRSLSFYSQIKENEKNETETPKKKRKKELSLREYEFRINRRVGNCNLKNVCVHSSLSLSLSSKLHFILFFHVRLELFNCPYCDWYGRIMRIRR